MAAASEKRQSSMRKTEAIRSEFVNLFDGKIICADCGRKMYFHKKKIDKDKRGRWYAFYECSTSVSKRYEHCSAHYTRQDKLEADVLSAIQLQVKAALDYDRLLDRLRGSDGEKSIRDDRMQKSRASTLNLRGYRRNGPGSMRTMRRGFWTKRNTLSQRRAMMSNIADLFTAVWMKRYSERKSLWRLCQRTTNGSR